MSASVQKNKLDALQAGRGIAAMLVVLHHASNHLKADFGYLPMGGIFHFGRSGVDFFFVLSGFIIFFVHAKDIGHISRLGHYLTRRFTRIYPIYWIVISIYLAIDIITAKSHSLTSFFTDASLLPISEIKGLGVAWTLQFEIFFYAMFSLAIMSKRVGIVVLLAWLTGIALHAINVIPSLDHPWPGIMFSTWNIEFMLGMLASYYLSKYQIKWPKTLLVFSVIGFLLVGQIENKDILNGSADIARLPYGLLSMLILMSLVAWERLGNLKVSSALISIGEASYSIYLIHLLAIGIAYKLLNHLGLLQKLSLDFIFVFLFISAVVGGVFISRLFEIPAMNLTRKLIDNTKAKWSTMR